MGMCNSKDVETPPPSSSEPSSQAKPRVTIATGDRDGSKKDVVSNQVQTLHKSVRKPATQAQSSGAAQADEKPTAQDVLKEGAVRLKNIFAKPLEMMVDFVAPVHAKTDYDKKFIEQALKGNFIFAHLSDDELSTLVQAMEPLTAEDGEEIIKQGDVGDYFYVIREGRVQFVVDGDVVGYGDSGGSFGELALLYNCPRAATCVATTKTECYRVDQFTFRKILAKHQMETENATREVLKEISFLEGLDDAYLTRIADALTEVSFRKGDVIIEKGTVGETFYMIKEGKCYISNISMEGSRYVDTTVGKGDFFGELALVTGDTRAATVTAQTDCVLYCMNREKFHKVLGPLEEAMQDSHRLNYLMTVPIIAQAELSQEDVKRLVDVMEKANFRKDETICFEGDVAKQALFIIQAGKISSKTNQGEVVTLKQGQYFGEDTLDKVDSETPSVLNQTTMIALEDTTCAVLAIKDLKTVLHRNMSSVFGDKYKTLHTDNLERSITLSALKKHRILGAGTFGQVWLVSDKTKDGTPYALKIQSKRTILGYNQEEGVIREKNIMASIDSPFIIRLVNAFQDETNLYMVLKLYQGGELFSIMHSDRRDGLPESSAKFYSAGILIGLSYMHKRKILYRDLKPENVLLGADGYTVIVDLGFAKVVTDKTYTLCGTPLYLAPEVILQRGHNKGADIWSYGVMIFELILGYTPFYARDIDQVRLFKNICRGKFNFPPVGISQHAQDIVSQILRPRQAERLGCFSNGDDDIRNHPWYKGSIDWGKLERKELKAPWIPKIKDPLDSSNFDNWDHLENDDQKYERPLSKAEQDKFQDF